MTIHLQYADTPPYLPALLYLEKITRSCDKQVSEPRTDRWLPFTRWIFFFNVHHRNFTIWKIKLHLRKCFLVLESQVFSLTKTTTFVWILWESFQFMAGACKSRTKCTSKAKLISAHTFISYLLSPPLYSVVAFLGTWHFHFFPLSVRICLYTYMNVHMHVDMYK